MRPCFAFTNIAAASAETPAVLSIFDEIGFWGVQAKDFKDSLEKVKAKAKEVQVEINSPGGDVFAGLAIYNMLKASGMTVVVKVMGVAASAASLIAMAGDKIVMPKNTFMMIHNPWSFAMGNADELRETADTLDKIGTSLRATYSARTGMSEEDLAPLLAKDTWLTADEAVEMGFADEVADEVKANARFDMARAELPENVKAVFQAAQKPATTDPVDEPAPEAALADQISAYAKSVGMETYASVWALSCTSLDEVKARATTAREITAICALLKQPDVAKTAIEANKSLADVRAQLIEAAAKDDESKHTSGVKPVAKESGKGNDDAKPGAGTTQAIWDSHHKNSPANRKK